jgi:hypothetical protein
MAKNHHDVSLLRQRKAALEDALYSGVSSVSVGGETTSFQNPAQLRKAISDIETQIAIATGGSRRRPVIASILLGGT